MGKADNIKTLKEGIRKYAPVVAEFFDREDKIIDYSWALYNFQVDPVHKQRQEVLLKSISNNPTNVKKKTMQI